MRDSLSYSHNKDSTFHKQTDNLIITNQDSNRNPNQFYFINHNENKDIFKNQENQQQILKQIQHQSNYQKNIQKIQNWQTQTKVKTNLKLFICQRCDQYRIDLDIQINQNQLDKYSKARIPNGKQTKRFHKFLRRINKGVLQDPEKRFSKDPYFLKCKKQYLEGQPSFLKTQKLFGFKYSRQNHIKQEYKYKQSNQFYQNNKNISLRQNKNQFLFSKNFQNQKLIRKKQDLYIDNTTLPSLNNNLNYMSSQNRLEFTQLSQQIDIRNDKIRLLMLEFYSSFNFLKHILKLNANLATTISLVKYLQIIRHGPIFPQKFDKWKSDKI